MGLLNFSGKIEISEMAQSLKSQNTPCSLFHQDWTKPNPHLQGHWLIYLMPLGALHSTCIHVTSKYVISGKYSFQAWHDGSQRVSTYFTKLSLSEVNPSEQAVPFRKNSFPSSYWRCVKSTCSDWPTIYELPRCSLIMFQKAKWFFHLENCSQLMFSGNERSGLACPLLRRRGTVRTDAM